mmetsp:Transcript_70376/g.182502  ORF Transcript_70376/g.182502 Transcript_70376/m.182502 type:complete len:334 (+) Transcript_70376:441-1442(+)
MHGALPVSLHGLGDLVLAILLPQVLEYFEGFVASIHRRRHVSLDEVPLSNEQLGVRSAAYVLRPSPHSFRLPGCRHPSIRPSDQQVYLARRVDRAGGEIVVSVLAPKRHRLSCITQGFGFALVEKGPDVLARLARFLDLAHQFAEKSLRGQHEHLHLDLGIVASPGERQGLEGSLHRLAEEACRCVDRGRLLQRVGLRLLVACGLLQHLDGVQGLGSLCGLAQMPLEPAHQVPSLGLAPVVPQGLEHLLGLEGGSLCFLDVLQCHVALRDQQARACFLLSLPILTVGVADFARCLQSLIILRLAEIDIDQQLQLDRSLKLLSDVVVQPRGLQH